MNKIAIFDLDNCISDDHWRMDRIDMRDPNPESRYHEYHSLSPFDKFGEKNRFLVHRHFEQGHEIIVLTARPVSLYYSTAYWLAQNGVHFSALIMRPEGVHTRSVELKETMVKGAIMTGFSVDRMVAAYDDRQDVVDMYKEKFGIQAERHFLHEEGEDKEFNPPAARLGWESVGVRIQGKADWIGWDESNNQIERQTNVMEWEQPEVCSARQFQGKITCSECKLIWDQSSGQAAPVCGKATLRNPLLRPTLQIRINRVKCSWNYPMRLTSFEIALVKTLEKMAVGSDKQLEILSKIEEKLNG
jgi:hypothetical protein